MKQVWKVCTSSYTFIKHLNPKATQSFPLTFVGEHERATMIPRAQGRLGDAASDKTISFHLNIYWGKWEEGQ